MLLRGFRLDGMPDGINNMPKRSTKQLAAFDLKAAREARGMSQEQTAEFLFQSQGTISRWEISGQTPELAREYWKLYWAVEDAKPKGKSIDRGKDAEGTKVPRKQRSETARSMDKSN